MIEIRFQLHYALPFVAADFVQSSSVSEVLLIARNTSIKVVNGCFFRVQCILVYILSPEEGLRGSQWFADRSTNTPTETNCSVARGLRFLGP